MSALFREIGETLYGHSRKRWHADMAQALGVSIRTVQRWASGQAEPPLGVYADLASLAKDHGLKIHDLVKQLADMEE
jgi:transcriptional regulator with XRE-family HTH domain